MAVTALGSVDIMLGPLLEVYPVVKESLKFQGQELLPFYDSETCELCLTETWLHSNFTLSTGIEKKYCKRPCR